MKIEYAFICKKADYETPGSLESINAFGICTRCYTSLKNLPAKRSFSIVALIRMKPKEVGDHLLEVRCEDPKGDLICPLIKHDIKAGASRVGSAIIEIIHIHNANFSSSGMHIIYLFINGTERQRLSFIVETVR